MVCKDLVTSLKLLVVGTNERPLLNRVRCLSVMLKSVDRFRTALLNYLRWGTQGSCSKKCSQ